MSMKYKMHVAIGQYEFIEVETDNLDELEEAKQNYQEIKKIPTGKEEGLDTKNWQRVLDQYLINQSMVMEDFDQLSDRQRLMINELKKALNRISNKK